MRKMFALLMTLFTVISCSTNQKDDFQRIENEMVEITPDYLEVIDGINEINAGLKPVETRARWWKYLCTAIADAGVSLIPGSSVATGITASSLVWTMLKEVKSKQETRAVSEPVISIRDTSISMTCLESPEWKKYDSDSDGYLHNRVIVNLYEDYGESLFDLSTSEFTDLAFAELARVEGREIEYSQSEMNEIYTSIDEYVNAFISSDTPDDFFNYLKIQYPDKNGEIEILKAAMDGFTALDVNEDEGKYVKKLMGIVDNSNLNEDSKKDVKSSLAVANASTRLWNEDALVEP